MIKGINKNKVINVFLLLASSVVPIIIMIGVYYSNGIFPGGANTILTFDMKSQYMPFYASLRYLYNSDNSIFLNMSGALGNNFYGFAYYIFSPFTWFTVLFSLESLPIVLYITYLLRIGLCGFGFCYYLLYTYEKKHYLGAVLLSWCYALMSYNVGYSVNLMWMDAVLMLPWLLVGVERVVRGEKNIVLTVATAFSMICNYYITCMSLIFVTIYSFIRIIETSRGCMGVCERDRIDNKVRFEKRIIRRCIELATGIALGIGLSMPAVLPGVIALKYGKLDEKGLAVTNLFRYNVIDVLGQLLAGKYDTVMDDGLPMIFCGTGTLLLLFFYFVNRKYSIKNKLLYSIPIIFYLISMCFIPLDRAMHGFQETTCFEVRYAFVFDCLLLIIAYKGIEDLIEIAERYHIHVVIKYLATAFVIVELTMNSSILISEIMVELHYGTATEYNMILESKTSLLDMIDDEDFYRISDDNAYTDNDGAWLGYNGFGYFSSCYNLALMNFLGSLGECQNHHILEDHDRTPLEESLFGAKYKISYAGWRTADEIIATHGFYTLSKNNDALSLGYMIDDGFNNPSDITDNAFINQNNMAKELSGIEEDVFVQLESIDCNTIVADGRIKQIEQKVVTEIDAPVWIYISKKNEDDNYRIYNEQYEKQEIIPKLYINGGDYGVFRGNDTGAYYMLYVGDYNADSVLDIELLDYDGYDEVYVSQFDVNVYNKVINTLKQKQFNVLEHSNGHFLGKIDAGQGGRMLLSLPAIDGWRIQVDGKRVDPENYRNVLLTIPLSSGVHDVDIRFISPGMGIGLLAGFVSISLFIVVLLRSGQGDLIS